MSRALWFKAIREARGPWLASAAILFGFSVLIVWVTSRIDPGPLAALLKSLPRVFEELSGIPFAQMLTPAGRVSMAYAHPVVLLTFLAWSIGRGSDSVSGEIERGTMEMLLAQPVRRTTVLAIQGIVTTCGSGLLAAAAWLGTCVGLLLVDLSAEVRAQQFLPGAANLFALAVCLAGLTTLASSCDSNRWRVVGVAGGFYLVQLIIKVVSRLAPGYESLQWFSLLTVFEPQLLIFAGDQTWPKSLQYNGALLAIGLVAYAMAAVMFSRRDLPAPL